MGQREGLLVSVGGWMAAAGSGLPCSGKSHIETPGVVQEPNTLVFVGAHAGQNDEVLLPALEGIHTGNLHFLNETVSCQSQPGPSLALPPPPSAAQEGAASLSMVQAEATSPQ